MASKGTEVEEMLVEVEGVRVVRVVLVVVIVGAGSWCRA